MSNANLGDFVSPVNDKIGIASENSQNPPAVPSLPPVRFCDPEGLAALISQFVSVPGDVGAILDLLRQLIDLKTDKEAIEKRQALDAARANPPIVATAGPPTKPCRAAPVDHTEENVKALQAFAALQMASDKFPSMSAVCKHSRIGRGIMYKKDRLLQFKAIYAEREAEYLKDKARTAVREVRRGFRQDRNNGGGLEAIDFDVDDE